MLKGRFMRIAWNVGDSLCMNIITVPDNPKKQHWILNRDVVIPCTLGVPFHEQMPQYLKDEFFPHVVDNTPPALEGWENGEEGNMCWSIAHGNPLQRGLYQMLARWYNQHHPCRWTT